MVRKTVLFFLCLAVIAPAALAATPELGRFSGKTSQGFNVAVRTKEAKHARFFAIRWSAGCGEQGTYKALATLESLKLGPKGGFTGHVFYTDTLKKGKSTRVYVKLAGRFTSSKTAAGKWRGAVRLLQGKKQLAYCKSGLVSWSAKLEQG